MSLQQVASLLLFSDPSIITMHYTGRKRLQANKLVDELATVGCYLRQEK